MEYADLELGIHQYKEQDYRIDFRLSFPSEDADIHAATHKPIELQIDFDLLNQWILQPQKYGACLAEMVFSDPALRVAFAKARILANEENKILRLRLFIGPSAPKLHELRWETLLDPESSAPLATDENLIFSRYLLSLDALPIKLKPKGNLHGLIVVASPNDLTPISIPDEIAQAKKGLAGITLSFLPTENRRATLENLIDSLRKEPGVDILYLVCHGRSVKKQPCIYLENDNGNMDIVTARQLATRMKQIKNHPRLVVMISCQSAGTVESDTFNGFGPYMVDIGIPAILAMQDKFSMETAARFIPTFFTELQRDGQIDRAVAAARASVSKRFDAWVPVLFMRLKSGRLWYKPGFSDNSQARQKLPAVWMNIQKGELTPIIGPGLVEPLLGSLRDIASRWAIDFNYPLSPLERESLPQVAQFLSTVLQPTFPFDNLEISLKKHLINTFPFVKQKTKTNGFGSVNLSLNQLLEHVATEKWNNMSKDPHQVLANFDLPIYITANQDNLLELALKQVGKLPRTFFCPWNNSIQQPDNYDLSILEGDKLLTDRPIVFHLFGSWDQPESVVLTEDDYFKFLMAVVGNKNAIPALVSEALVSKSLLFLGFQIEEWSFRTILHSLLSYPGAGKLHNNKFAHMAAQIEIEDERLIEPIRARKYLEQYFYENEKVKISVFWGSPSDFISELLKCQKGYNLEF